MAGEGGREGGGVHHFLVQLWVRKKLRFDVWHPHPLFVKVFHLFLKRLHGLPARPCVLKISFRNAKFATWIWSGKSRATRRCFSPGDAADNSWVRSQLGQKKTFLQWYYCLCHTRLGTNQASLPGCWWKFLRIIEPQVPQQRTVSFFKWFVPKPIFRKRRHTRNILVHYHIAKCSTVEGLEVKCFWGQA